MRPVLRLLSDDLIANLVAEAPAAMQPWAVEIHNQGRSRHAVRLRRRGRRSGWGASGSPRLIDGPSAQSRVPSVLRRARNQTHDFSGDNVYFTPGSAAIPNLDGPPAKCARHTAD